MKYLILLLSLFSLSAEAKCRVKPIKVAVVDTGLDLTDPRFFEHLCPNGHKDFTGLGLKDMDGHGTHVAGLIQKYAGDANYCMIIYKYYFDEQTGQVNLRNEILAFEAAAKAKVDLVNMSGGGPEFNEREYLFIAENPQITFVVSAGNENENLDIPGYYYYPASYWLPNEIVVGSIQKDGSKAPLSNFSKKIVAKEVGTNVISYLPNDRTGEMSGTSMATAIHTGKMIREMATKCDK